MAKRTFTWGNAIKLNNKGEIVIAEEVDDVVQLTPELALREAIICQQLFKSNKVTNRVNEGFGDDFQEAAHTIHEKQDYLFWDTDLLLQIMDKLGDFMGATVPFTQKMSQIWTLDASVKDGNGLIFGVYFRADSKRLFIAHIEENTSKEELSIDERGYAIWHKPYYWGEPITNVRQAYAAAVYTWLQQPYVCQTEAIQHSRQVKRQAERKGQILKNINVIQFRKPEGITTQHTEGDSGRELHCCFERAGHTRRQPYGPKNGLRRIQWIAPTFVGDPSKPFKTKGQTLYRVTR